MTSAPATRRGPAVSTEPATLPDARPILGAKVVSESPRGLSGGFGYTE
jgi:hypothetical protein